MKGCKKNLGLSHSTIKTVLSLYFLKFNFIKYKELFKYHLFSIGENTTQKKVVSTIKTIYPRGVSWVNFICIQEIQISTIAKVIF